MKNKLYIAFDHIRADDALIKQTADCLYANQINAKDRRPFSRLFQTAVTFAATAVLAMGIAAYYFCFTPSSYISVDVNPSIELTLNRLDRVIHATAFNPEGEQILSRLTLSGQKYDTAAALLVAAINHDGYFNNNPFISVTVNTTAHDKEQILCDILQQSVSAQVHTWEQEAEVEVFPVTAEVHSDARQCHMSPARYLAIQELMQVDENATLEEYSQTGICQIRQRTQWCHNNQNTHNSHGHHGRH